MSKATFYYTAEGRVDFRQLIKDMAEAFKVRIEMRQIGSRQEASRLGGIGSCGRELCCYTWLTDFRSVSTSAARYQQLSLNPQKLAGQCGKLKCCLNYELDMYIDAMKAFPKPDTRLKTEKGNAYHIKTDVFKNQMWYVYEGESNSGLIGLTPERVKEIFEMNKEGKKPAELKDFVDQVDIPLPDYSNVVGQDSLNRFENYFKKKKKKKSKQKNPNNKTSVQANKNDVDTNNKDNRTIKKVFKKPTQDQNNKKTEGEVVGEQKPRPYKKRRNNNNRNKNKNTNQVNDEKNTNS